MSGNEPPGVGRSTRPSSDAVALGALAPAGSFRDTRTDAMDAWWGERGGRGASTARDPTRSARAKKARKKGRDWRGKIKSFAGGSHLAQGAEALAVDGGLVHENLVGAVVGGDEAEALLGVEPLDLRARRGGRGEVRRLRENSSIHAPARRCGRIHRHPVDRRTTADATRAGLGRSSSAPCR